MKIYKVRVVQDIHLFHIDHNASPPPPHPFPNFALLLSPGTTVNTQVNLKTMVMQSLGGGGKQDALLSI